MTSQFENQLRAVCGLPLGSTDLRSDAVVMMNILGDGNGNTLQGVEELMKQEGVYLHLYGKGEAKAGRKMGHITILGENKQRVLETSERVTAGLHWN